MASKTSFKKLLSKSAAKPTVNIQDVRAKREQLNSLKNPASSARRQRRRQCRRPQAASRHHRRLRRRRDLCRLQRLRAAGLATYSKWVRAALATTAMLCNSNPAAPPLAADTEEEEAPKGALPNAFFDDPQNDPANKGKEVARTNKEQSRTRSSTRSIKRWRRT